MSVSTDLVQIQIQSNQIFKEEKYCCGCCRRSPHLGGLFLCIAVWSLLIYTIYFYIYHKEETEFDTLSPIAIILPTSLSGVYLFYLIQAFLDQTSRYLWNMKVSGKNDIFTYIERLKRTPPAISMNCECFHYETRTRYVTESYTEYVNGQSVLRTRTRLETYEEKVVTHRGCEIFNYREWSDNSGSVSNETFNYNIVRVDFFKTWTAGDEQTQAAFDDQYNAFKSKYQNRDTYFNSSYGVDIDDYKPNALSVIEEKCYLSWGMYAIITIFFLASVFYRYWFDRCSVKANFEFKKIVKI